MCMLKKRAPFLIFKNISLWWAYDGASSLLVFFFTTFSSFPREYELRFFYSHIFHIHICMHTCMHVLLLHVLKLILLIFFCSLLKDFFCIFSLQILLSYAIFFCRVRWEHKGIFFLLNLEIFSPTCVFVFFFICMFCGFFFLNMFYL